MPANNNRRSAPRTSLARPAALAAAIAATSASPLVAAQDEAANTTNRFLEEVTVTAQRREQNMQTVPISVTAANAEMLKLSGITTVDELPAITPGLVMTRQLRGSTPFIRGVGATSVTVGNESPVAQYVDGVYMKSPVGNIFSFNNIERVEILKGPQGTLFGRNATGGLVNVITKDPQREPMLQGSVSYGNYDTWSASLYGSAGGDRVAMDFAYYQSKQSEGFGKAVNLNNKDINMVDELAFRSKLVWDVTDIDRITIAADWADNRTDIGLHRVPVPPNRLAGGTSALSNLQNAQGAFPTYMDFNHTYGASIKYTRDLDGITFSSLTAYRAQNSKMHFDQDGGITRGADVITHEWNDSIQQEFLLQGVSGALNWTTGLFYLTASSTNNPLDIRSASPTANFDRYPEQDTTSISVFGEGTYALTDATRLTLGLRYTKDKQEFNVFDRQVLTGVTTYFEDEADYKEPTWRLAIDHQLGDHMVYASYNRGYKSGMFNTGALAAQQVEPEQLDAYEIGAKTNWFNDRLQANVAAYLYDYTDMQVQRVVTGSSVIDNAAKAEIKGLELEVIAVPDISVGELKLSFGASFMDSEYEEFPGGTLTTPNPAGGNVLSFVDLAGNEVIRAPKWTYNANIDYILPVSGGEMFMNVNYFITADFYWEPDNRLKEDGYDIINAQLGYRFGPDMQYAVRLFGKNLGDSEYSVYSTASALGDGQAMAPPLTFGIAFDFEFR